MLADSPGKMLVINEWLFQDIKGENGQPKRQETRRLPCTIRARAR